MKLKELLLSYGVVCDNDYLTLYCDLMEANRGTARKKFLTQRHHVVPRCYFKANGLEVDNSVSNVVNLSHKDHVLAHYYLCMCSIDESFKHNNILAVRITLRDVYLKNILTEVEFDEFKQSLKYYQSLQEEANRAKSKNYTRHRWVNNGIEEKVVDVDDVDFYVNSGWYLGRLPFDEEFSNKISKSLKGRTHTTSEETKNKISMANKGRKYSDAYRDQCAMRQRGKVWVTDGSIEIMIQDSLLDTYLSKGFNKGRNPMSREQRTKISETLKGEELSTITKIKISSALKGKQKPPRTVEHRANHSKALSGRKWYNDGFQQKLLFTCPEGWTHGKIR